MVSIIIPTYNEAEIIAPTLARLSRLRGDFEVIVADGASTDRTAAIVESRLRSYPRVLWVLACERPRAVQLNRAAELAHGDVLLFLYADVSLAEEALDSIERVLARSEVVGGNFEIAFEGNDFWSRFFTWGNRVRRRFGIYYGDSAVFVRRSVFEQLGGFKPIPIMDDYEFIRRLKRCGRTAAGEGRELPVHWPVGSGFKDSIRWAFLPNVSRAGTSPCARVRRRPGHYMGPRRQAARLPDPLRLSLLPNSPCRQIVNALTAQRISARCAVCRASPALDHLPSYTLGFGPDSDAAQGRAGQIIASYPRF